MTLPSGTRLGPYEILAPIGAGGMGEVYRARDTRLEREVAIKIVSPALANDTTALARFEREAKAVAALSHPNILAVHDFGDSNGTRYAVTELLNGESLRQRLSEGPMPQRKAVEIAREVALGLAAAHEKGIVHRDLKPENLFLTADGRVKILDFGLARQLNLPSASDTQSPTVTPGTEPGTVLGTVGYMAPEQLRGKPADGRSDIFSLGAVLYEMLSGHRAFRGDTAIETMNAILKEDPPELSRSGRDVAPGVERIVAHCLEKRPEDRFQSARDLAFDLGSLSAATPTSGIATVSNRSRWKRRLAFALVGTIGLVAAFFIGSRLARPSQGPVRFQRLTFRRGNILSARFAPDGQTVVYGAAWEGHPSELFSVRTDSVESRPLGLDHADVLSVSSSGELAVKLRKGTFLAPNWVGTLARMPLGGGAPRELLEDVLSAAWTYGSSEELAVIRQSPTGTYRLEWPIGHILYESDFLASPLLISPDGDRVLFVETDMSGNSAIWTMDRNGNRRLLTHDWKGLMHLAWSRKTGEVLFIAGHETGDQALRAVSLSGRERVIWRATPGFTLHDVDSEGRLLVERSIIRRSVFFMGPGTTQEKDLGWLDGTQLTKLSGDGKSLLFFEAGEGAGPRFGVFVRPTDGGPAVRLGDGYPVDLSKDGKWVLTITQTTPSELVLLPTGPGSPRKIPSPGLNPVLAFLMPDGRINVLSSSPGHPTQAYELPPNGGAEPKLIDLPGINWDAHGAMSLDWKRIAYSTTDRKILLLINGAAPRPVPGATLAPGEYITVFSPDNRYLQTQTVSEIPARIFQTDLQTGQKTLWKQIQPADLAGVIGIDEVHFTDDESAYAYTYTRAEMSDLYVVDGLR